MQMIRQVAPSVYATPLSLQNLVTTFHVALLHPAVVAVADATSASGACILLALPLRSMTTHNAPGTEPAQNAA